MLPFVTGKATRDLPGHDGADKQRASLERDHAAKIEQVFAVILDKIAGLSNITPDSAWAAYQDAAPALKDALTTMLADGAALGIAFGKLQAQALMITASKPSPYQGVNWDLANQHVIDWINGGGTVDDLGYADFVTTAIVRNHEAEFRALVGQWTQAGTPLQELVDQLQATVFYTDRATMIAETEITRSFFEGNRAAWQASGVIGRMRWQTSNDDLVCPDCGPLNGQTAPIDGDFDGYTPPFHPRCRCWVTAVPS